MSSQTQKLKQLAQKNGLDFKDCGAGHIQIKGPGALVNYWPESKRRTAYVAAGAKAGVGRSVAHCSPQDVIALCLENTAAPAPSAALKGQIMPSRNPRDPKNQSNRSRRAPRTTNSAGLKHVYRGETPPWEFPGPIIHCASDLLRLKAYDLETQALETRAEAEAMDAGDFE